MELPLDILDYIFGFLKSHPETLIACSRAHPIFAQVVERFLYHNITIHTDQSTYDGYCLEPLDTFNLLSETPRIANYVRILCITLGPLAEVDRILEETALVLPLLPMLECIILKQPYSIWWLPPLSFSTALENCLHLPTLQEVHVSALYFPLSTLDNCANINCFSLSGSPKMPDCSDDIAIYPQLKSLSFEDIDDEDTSFTSWAKQDIVKLRSLKCGYSSEPMILEFLEICSDTLINLDLTLGHSPCRFPHIFWRRRTEYSR